VAAEEVDVAQYCPGSDVHLLGSVALVGPGDLVVAVVGAGVYAAGGVVGAGVYAYGSSSASGGSVGEGILMEEVVGAEVGLESDEPVIALMRSTKRQTQMILTINLTKPGAIAHPS